MARRHPVPEGVMGWDEWVLLIVSVAVAAYLAVALWKPDRF
jgi:K+-transporting ATPase KdpF subunit